MKLPPLCLWLSGVCSLALPLQAAPVRPISLKPMINPRAIEHIHAHPPTKFSAENSFAEGHEPGNHPRNRPVRVDSLLYDLELSVDPVSGSIKGRLDYSFRIEESAAILSLDALDMRILAVRDAHGDNLPYDYDGELLTITHPDLGDVGESRTVTILYEAMRAQSFYLTGADVTNPTRMVSAYTFTQPEGSQSWFPCIDRPGDKALADLKIDVPSAYKVLSNGHLLAVAERADATRYHYRMDVPLAPYLMSLNVGAYDVHRLGHYKGVPLDLWTPPSLTQAALAETSDTALMMAAFSRFTGLDYPFATYSQSVAQAWGTSMEHQTATTMGGWRISGDGAGVGVVAHELAHQWFGDWVTCEQWSELWLNEGFATYLPAVYFAASNQTHELIAYEDYWRSGYFDEAPRKVRALSAPQADWEDLFDSHAYEKGALVIKLMRQVANSMPASDRSGQEENFSRALRLYLGKHARGTVRNSDLQAALEATTGRSWQTFFDQWVRSPGHPVIKLDWTATDGKLELALRQEQTQRSERVWIPFSFPAELEVLGEHGERRIVRLDVYQSTQHWTWQLPFTPMAVQFDPEWMIPAEVSLADEGASSADNWLHVLTHSPSVRSRLSALHQLLKDSQTPADEALIQRILADSSLYLKAHALTQLTSLSENRGAVEQLLQDMAGHAGEPGYERVVRSAIALAKAWLVENASDKPSADDEATWRDDYHAATLTIERQAILQKLAHASLERAQEFALARLGEARWVTRDRGVLLDVLTKSPGPTVLPFLVDALGNTSLYWFRKIVRNLTNAKFDHPDLVPVLVQQAAGYRYDEGRIAALQLLAQQKSSRESLCPDLVTLAQSSRQSMKDPLTKEVEAELTSTLAELGCKGDTQAR